MTAQEAEEYLKEKNIHHPSEIEIGSKICGHEVIEIKNTVNGKATYASAFVCKKK